MCKKNFFMFFLIVSKKDCKIGKFGELIVGYNRMNFVFRLCLFFFYLFLFCFRGWEDRKKSLVIRLLN